MHAHALAFVLALTHSVATDLAILASAVAIGLAIGAIRFRSIRLGLSGVLFSSLLFGQIGFTIDVRVLDFLRDFSLIIFMYALGLQVGPSFGTSVRSDGIRLNALALAVLVLGAIMSAALTPLIPRATAAGLYSGAFNTTPGLAAAAETFRGKSAVTDGAAMAARNSLAYSITYPFGVVGPMIVIVVLRALFRVRLAEEKRSLEEGEKRRRTPIETIDIEVTSSDQVGKRLDEHPLLRDKDIVISRLFRKQTMAVPAADTIVRIGDIYRVVGPRDTLEELTSALGQRHGVDLSKVRGDVERAEILVTRTHVLHRSLRELNLPRHTGVRIAHVTRAGVELVATGSLRLAFGDQVVAVGPKAGLRLVEAELGNSAERLNQSQLIPIFLGIVLGVLVGSIPLALPGAHSSLRIGLAGGSLLAAIALSRIGSLGSIVWYMPAAANQIIRDFGLAIFLACVGFASGDHFIQRAAENSGLVLFLWGAAITMLPVFVVACFARIVLKMNFITLAGWVAGAMGSSPALLFTQEMTSSNAPALPYAAVLPVAELVPIVCAQVLAIVALHR